MMGSGWTASQNGSGGGEPSPLPPLLMSNGELRFPSRVLNLAAVIHLHTEGAQYGN